jgi:peptidoglycan/xylan/chitin deacetylase (PgdA/CDA1 family)
MRRAAVALCFFAIPLACAEDDPTLSRTSQPLIAEEQQYTGMDLGAKELVLTFDDGPGPAAVTGALSTYLKTRPRPIRATFFVNGACIAATTLSPNESCGEATAGANTVLAQLVADGHLVANHTTTHRDLATLQTNLILSELEDTDALIKGYVPYGRFFFRAPYGSWSTRVFNSLKDTAMNRYVGPIYWSIDAQDWDCWPSGLTTKACGDRYLSEIRRVGKGIVLLHDPYSSASGNTVDLVKYIVPILEGEGFTFKALEDVPALKALLPKCDASCSACSGPSANDCTACKPGTVLASGACVAEQPDAQRSVDEIPPPPPDTETAPPSARKQDRDSGCASAATPRGGSLLLAVVVGTLVRRRRRSLPCNGAATN